MLPEILLWLFIINLGTAFGAGLYETRIILPQWFTRIPGGGYAVNSAAMRDNDTGRKFWGGVTTMPLTLLTLANLWAGWQSAAPQHNWWQAAAVITLVERIGTFSFFIPNAIKFMNADTQSAAMSNLAGWWLRANYLRLALNLAGLLAAMRALSL